MGIFELDRLAGPALPAAATAGSDVWIFAYGSLMWEPGFPYREAVPARLHGRHRRFCVYSHGHRGTPEWPGLVLGLDRGGACKGIAYCIPAVDVPAALDYLREREMQSRVYALKSLGVALENGRRVEALVFVVDRAHPHYVGGLDLAATARLIRQGEGCRGTACQYLYNTVVELDRLGVVDGPLHRLARLVREMGQSDERKAA